MTDPQGMDAKAAYEQGEAKLAAGQYDEALTLFMKADDNELPPPHQLKYKIALIHERLGHVNEAVAAYEAFLQMGNGTPEDHLKETIADAKARIAALRGPVPPSKPR